MVGKQVVLRDFYGKLADGRTAVSKRFRELYNDFVSDLGGEGQLSQAQLQLIRRATMLSVMLEGQECTFAISQDMPDPRILEHYNTIAGGLKRILETLGIDRVARDITPSLEDYQDGVGEV